VLRGVLYPEAHNNGIKKKKKCIVKGNGSDRGKGMYMTAHDPQTARETGQVDGLAHACREFADVSAQEIKLMSLGSRRYLLI
jgi:hypothetical protein